MVNDHLNWHQLLSEAIGITAKKPIESNHIWIASDYSRANDAAQTFSFLIADAERSLPWIEARNELRIRTQDEMKYKRIGNEPDSKHTNFIDIADKLPGCLVTIHAPLDVVYNLSSREEIAKFKEVGKLVGHWKPSLLGRATLIANIARTLFLTLIQPTAKIRWVSDNDPIFETPEREIDVARIFKIDCPAAGKKQFEAVDFWKVKEDNEEKFLKDLASIPDLASGAMHEWSIAKHGDYSKPGRFSLVSSWLSDSESSLKKLNFRYTGIKNQGVRMDGVQF